MNDKKKNTNKMLLATLLLGSLPLAMAQVAGYPTLDRVLFVEECVRNHPDRLRQEMIYKCTCLFDHVAERIPHAQFSELETAANALSIAGERGSTVRTDDIRERAKRFRAVMSEGRKSCLFQP
ncbi:MAG: hypothetical protein NBV65_06805 [Burkholderiaceae bacterium]|nr:hypothetical protein [Burkholderiaceae bacterium]